MAANKIIIAVLAFAFVQACYAQASCNATNPCPSTEYCNSVTSTCVTVWSQLPNCQSATVGTDDSLTCTQCFSGYTLNQATNQCLCGGENGVYCGNTGWEFCNSTACVPCTQKFSNCLSCYNLFNPTSSQSEEVHVSSFRGLQEVSNVQGSGDVAVTCTACAGGQKVRGTSGCSNSASYLALSVFAACVTLFAALF